MHKPKRKAVTGVTSIGPSVRWLRVDWSIEGILRNFGQTIALIIAMILGVHTIKQQLEWISRAADARTRIQVEAIQDTVSENNARVFNIVADTRSTETVILAKLEEHTERLTIIAKRLGIRYPDNPKPVSVPNRN